MRRELRSPGSRQPIWLLTSSSARAKAACTLARLRTEQQADFAHALLLEEIEHADDLFVAYCAIGGDHDRLLRILRLPVADAGDQFISRHAQRRRGTVAQPQRLIRAHLDFDRRRRRGEASADARELDHAGV